MGDRETYLKTQQLADALGVSTSSVKRWVDLGAIQATKTTGKHRLVSLSSALKFARDGKYPTDSLLALYAHPTIAEIDHRVVAGLCEALKAGDARRASAIVSSAFLADRDAVALADQLIRPVMERIGHNWMVGAWDVYQEHQATQIIAGSLVELIRRASRDDAPGRPLAIGAAPEGDIYTLPILLGELVLREGGWDVRNLGNDLPFRSLASAIRAYRPKLAFLSASSIADQSRFLQEYSYFYEAATQVGAAIIVGGRALDADLRSRLVYASYGERMAHLAEFARQLQPATGTAPGPGSNQSATMDIST
jgi:MerR family transcriptional regulator, light-induced transcriptional regulator